MTSNKNFYSEKPGMAEVTVDGITYRQGDRVEIITGKRRTDATDIFFKGKTATIENILADYEDRIYFAVTFNDDPAQDIWQEIGIYRFFQADEIKKFDDEQ